MVVDSFQEYMRQVPIGTFVLRQSISGDYYAYHKVAADIFVRENVDSHPEECYMRLANLSKLQCDVYEVDDGTASAAPSEQGSLPCNCELRELLLVGCTRGHR